MEEAVKIGMNATHEAARIGVNVVSAAPKILEEKAQFVQGLGKTVEEHGGRVKQVIFSLLLLTIFLTNPVSVSRLTLTTNLIS